MTHVRTLTFIVGAGYTPILVEPAGVGYSSLGDNGHIVYASGSDAILYDPTAAPTKKVITSGALGGPLIYRGLKSDDSFAYLVDDLNYTHRGQSEILIGNPPATQQEPANGISQMCPDGALLGYTQGTASGLGSSTFHVYTSASGWMPTQGNVGAVSGFPSRNVNGKLAYQLYRVGVGYSCWVSDPATQFVQALPFDQVFAINSQDQVVGVGEDPHNNSTVGVVTVGGGTRWMTLPPEHRYDGGSIFINDSGLVLVGLVTPNPDLPGGLFLWDSTLGSDPQAVSVGWTDDVPQPMRNGLTALGLNNQAQIFCAVQTSSGIVSALLTPRVG